MDALIVRTFIGTCRLVPKSTQRTSVTFVVPCNTYCGICASNLSELHEHDARYCIA